MASSIYGANYGAKSVLITGGASFIGSHLAEALVELGARVRVADDLSSGRIENLVSVLNQIEFCKGDLSRPAFARECARGQEIVFHLAARHGGRGYIDSHPVEVLSNLRLDHTVFEASCEEGVRKIVYASSACVYPTSLQQRELNLLKEEDAGFEEPGRAFADGEYGWAKLMGELQLQAFCKRHSISGIACRLFTSYGERENETHAVIALVLKAALRLDPFPVWGSGLQTRNYTYVADTVMGLVLAGARVEEFQVVNVGGSRPYTVLELLDEIFRAVSWRPGRILPEPDKPVGVLSRASDNTRCRSLLGWEPSIPIGEGVDRTVRWYLEAGKAPAIGRIDRLLTERDV